MTASQHEELQRKVDFARTVEELMNDVRFKEVIVEGYIESTAEKIGSNFDGSEDQIDTLKAITHLKQWLESAIDEGYKLKEELAR